MLVTFARIAMTDGLSSSADAAEAIVINCKIKFGSTHPPVHFDEGEHPATARDQIDLPARGLHPLGQDAQALEPQVLCGKRFTAAPACLALSPAAHLSSSARA